MAIKSYKGTFLAYRREWWAKNIYSVQALLKSHTDGLWSQGRIQTKKVAGDEVIITASFEDLYNSSDIIVGLKLIDLTGATCFIKNTYLPISSAENMMFRFRLPIVEIADTSENMYNATLTVTDNVATSETLTKTLDTTKLVVFVVDNGRVMADTEYTAAYANNILTITLTGSTWSSINVVCPYTEDE